MSSARRAASFRVVSANHLAGALEGLVTMGLGSLRYRVTFNSMLRVTP